MSSQEVPQPNELVEGGQDISVEEPPAKTSKIVEEALKNFEYKGRQIQKNCVEEACNQMTCIVKGALKNFEYACHQIRKNCVEETLEEIEEAAEEPPTKRSKIVEETLQKKDAEINLLRKQITDYERERRNISKAIVAMKKINVPKHNPNGALKAQLVEKFKPNTDRMYRSATRPT